MVAVNVGDLSDRAVINQSLFAVGGASLDAMMRANTKLNIKQADIIIEVPLAEFGSLDWRRSKELIDEGYKATEAMRDRLLPLAIPADEYAKWQAARNGRRRTSLPAPSFLRVEGFSSSDERQLTTLLARHIGADFDADAFQTDVAVLSGLDRYESITWQFVKNAAGENGMLVQARPKSYGPPFMMLGLNLENTTSEDFRVTFTGRYLAFDVLGSGSELRIDGTLGSDPGLAFTYYRPFGGSPLFVEPYAGMVASHLQRDSGGRGGGELRADADARRHRSRRQSRTRQRSALRHLRRTAQGQRRCRRPGIARGQRQGGGQRVEVAVRLAGQSGGAEPRQPGRCRTSSTCSMVRTSRRRCRAAARAPNCCSCRARSATSGRPARRGRFFALGGGGTSFGKQPLPTDQFTLGRPFHLGAHDQGEFIGDHYYIATGGYLHQLGRLPDFMGGPLFAGAWLENGDAFNSGEAAFRTNASGGVILDTLVGPVILAGSAGFDGSWRTYIGVGRIFGRRRE